LTWFTIRLWTKLLLLVGMAFAGLIIAPKVLGELFPVVGVDVDELDLELDIGVELLNIGVLKELLDFWGVGWITFLIVFKSSLGFIAWAGRSMY